VGDFRLLDSEGLLAFMRLTDRVEETVVVLANPSKREVCEVLALRDSRVMNRTALVQHVPSVPPGRIMVDAGLMHACLPARSWMVLSPEVQRGGGYSPYERAQ